MVKEIKGYKIMSIDSFLTDVEKHLNKVIYSEELLVRKFANYIEDVLAEFDVNEHDHVTLEAIVSEDAQNQEFDIDVYIDVEGDEVTSISLSETLLDITGLQEYVYSMYDVDSIIIF